MLYTINVLLRLFVALGILHTILLHVRLVIPNLYDLQQESSAPDMATTNAFMELGHDAGTLISTYE